MFVHRISVGLNDLTQLSILPFPLHVLLTWWQELLCLALCCSSTWVYALCVRSISLLIFMDFVNDFASLRSQRPSQLFIIFICCIVVKWIIAPEITVMDWLPEIWRHRSLSLAGWVWILPAGFHFFWFLWKYLAWGVHRIPSSLLFWTCICVCVYST